MTAAYRLKGLGWFASVVVIALACYLVSLKVASERKALDDMNGRILAAHRDLRNLETEFNSRANLAQLERWNGDVLALTAPAAVQFVGSEAQLAQIDARAPDAVAPGTPQVQTAAYIVPTAPVAYDPGAVLAATDATAKPASTPAPRQPVATAAVASIKPMPTLARTKPIVAAVASVPVTRAMPARRKPQAIAALDRKLLSEHTLGDLVSGARAEKLALR